ncbi:VOC family protein [Hamadaea tsunoensis]|uniref:VOC family protein n=1 Tax=Hamadaea tsunoensis TaxID=53368 RepID=UPI0003FB05CC|nr:VOC family protein [Hamadaea tsunoensis]
MTDKITPRQFHESDGVEDWRVVGEGAVAVFRTGDLATGARFVQAICALPGLDEHHPDIDLRYATVTLRLITIAAAQYGLREGDVELARRISAVAKESGLAAAPELAQTIQLSIDALVIPEVLPFWRAVLGYDDRADSGEDLIDPRTRGPLAYFQQTDEARTQRNNIHVDVWVAHDQAEARIAAAVAAGGRILTREYAPSWTVLADAEGNEACVCTWQSPA